MIDFWRIIGSNPAQDADEVRSALGGVAERIDGLDPEDLIRFAEGLYEALYALDRRELGEIPVTFPGGLEFTQTSDHFLYARCACVLSGKETYDVSLKSSSGFMGFVRPFHQAAEELLYLAPRAYEKKVGRGMGAVDGPPVESKSNVQGWAQQLRSNDGDIAGRRRPS